MSAVIIRERPRTRRGPVVPIITIGIRHVILVAVLIITLYPLLWMLAASFEPSAQIFFNAGLVPKTWSFANYREGWFPLKELSFTRLFANSLIIAGLSMVGNVASCTLAAYAFGRLHFRFKNLLFAVMLLTIMLPYQVVIIPQYILFYHLGWLNTYLPLIVPRFLGVDGFFIFLMVQFIRGLPRELDEAAMIDGCRHWHVFYRIIVPLSVPAMATTAIFTFINSWNDFLGPLLYLTTPDSYTVPIGLSLFIDSTEASQWGPLFAMSVLSLVPIFLVFLAFQRLLTRGIATTGIK